MKAVELVKQGRNEELWQMCCGFLNLSLEQFMSIQKRLLLEQITLLNRCVLGKKIMQGVRPETVDEFRRLVPLTTYSDYCPELAEKREDILPAKPAFWVHTSGRSGEYPCKWIPITPAYAHELSLVTYGVGLLSGSKRWGDRAPLTTCPKIVYTVAPRPYWSGTLLAMLGEQTPSDCFPRMEEAEGLSFEERIKLGFRQAIFHGFDYFFGLSLVLAAVGEKLYQSSGEIDIRPFLSSPNAMLRLSRGLVKSKLAGRPLMPRDLWSLKGIIGSGIDSGVYRERIRELWGRYPLDIYASTEGSIMATQTWDYDGMTFIPNLNFLEFIPEKEHFKWQIDHNYQPEMVLLDEVKAGEIYEMVITSLHGGALVRYRVGDMVKITSLRNEKLGIMTPQMAFERRADDLLDFVVVRLTEKTIWRAIQDAGIAYEDWTAYKKPGEPVLVLYVELKDGYRASEAELSAAIYEQIMKSNNSDNRAASPLRDDFAGMIDLKIELNVLPRGAFANYMSQRRAEGADLAHLKPPHINPSEKVLSLLTGQPKVAPRVTTREPVPA